MKEKYIKILLIILSIFIIIYGILIISSSIYFFRSPIIISILTLSMLIGIVIFITNKEIGKWIIFVSSIGWIIRYFEHLSYLILYDFSNNGRKIIVIIPLFLAITLFVIIYKYYIAINIKYKEWKYILGSILIMILIGFVSYGHKTQVREYNCWYYLDKNTNENKLKLLFAVAPDHTFEVTSNSVNLKNSILKNAIFDKTRKGYYCPETKVKVVTRYYEIVDLEILGFHNTSTNKIIKFKKPYKIQTKTIKGKKEILMPKF